MIDPATKQENTGASGPAQLAKRPAMAIARRIHGIHQRLVSHVTGFAAKEEIEPVHASMLHTLGLAGPMRMGDLANRIVIGSASMTRRAKQLEALGLVVRERSEISNREVLIRLTDAGAALFERSFTTLHAAHEAFFDGCLSAEEQQQLLTLLQKLR